jgi:hypothetical protein
MAIPQAVVAMSDAERSVVPAIRRSGAAADIVILSVAGCFGQSFALDDACMRTAAADLAFSFSHPADQAPPPTPFVPRSLKRTEHCCRNAANLVEGPLDNQFASRFGRRLLLGVSFGQTHGKTGQTGRAGQQRYGHSVIGPLADGWSEPEIFEDPPASRRRRPHTVRKKQIMCRQARLLGCICYHYSY